jgi:uncharacterized protein YndB with AHSA1/START domain
MTTNHSLNDVTPNFGEREFEIVRMFDAPRELVYRMFTEAEHVARWWAPLPYTIPVCTIDLRPGGKWHYCMRSPEGELHWCLSTYREIIEPELVVFTSLFADEDANTTDEIPEYLMNVKLTEQDGRTKLTLGVHFEEAEHLKLIVEMGMIEGITMTFGNLDSILKE